MHVGEVVEILGNTLRAAVGSVRQRPAETGDPEEAAAQHALDQARAAVPRAESALEVSLSEMDSERGRQAEAGKLDSRRLTEVRRMVSAAEDELSLARTIEARATGRLKAVRERIGARLEAEAVSRAITLLKVIGEHGGKAVAAMDELRDLYAGSHQRRLPPPLALWSDDALRHWLSMSLAILTGGDEAA
jgi:hypothetical protein